MDNLLGSQEEIDCLMETQMDGFVWGKAELCECLCAPRCTADKRYELRHYASECKYSYLSSFCIIVSYKTDVCNFQIPGLNETYLV